MFLKQCMIMAIICLFGSAFAQAQYRRIDTTMKIGKAGYRIYSNNRSSEKNSITISPVGFESGSREASFEIKGRVTGAEADDLNNDGFPDLVIYLATGEGDVYGKVIGIYSVKNESFRPILFPDIMDDPKLGIGYRGHDEYSLIEGNLMRRFPIYQSTDSTRKNWIPTGVMRQIQYRAMPGEAESLKFKVIRSYEFKKSQ